MANRSSDSRRTPTTLPVGAKQATHSAASASPPSAPTQAAASQARTTRRRGPAAEPAAPATISAAPSAVSVSAQARRAMVAEAAYLRAERRGFAPGGEEADWLAAEKEVNALLSAGQGGPQ